MLANAAYERIKTIVSQKKQVTSKQITRQMERIEQTRKSVVWKQKFDTAKHFKKFIDEQRKEQT